ncbi:hypothetical protein Rcae01_04044 [Novipirellula caenicola]|uniref:Uncharacterized protein n=1 Tax=Novipirellula caenicola TaxID=1536901 RepID=A0ABP9VTU8_9BACT
MKSRFKRVGDSTWKGDSTLLRTVDIKKEQRTDPSETAVLRVDVVQRRDHKSPSAAPTTLVRPWIAVGRNLGRQDPRFYSTTIKAWMMPMIQNPTIVSTKLSQN